MSIGRLHVLTDYFFQQSHAHPDLARMALEGGADTIQFRQKTGGVRHRLVEARRTHAVCRAYGVPLLINDRLDLTQAVGAEGVHLGQADIPLADARRILGPEAILGATATTTAQAVHAYKQGASYIGFGPVYATHSKSNPASVKGLAGLEAACRAVPIPVIAIAGITRARVADVVAAGAYGIAVMTAVTLADDPTAATRALRETLDAALS